MISRALTPISLAAALVLTSLCVAVAPAEAEPYRVGPAITYHRPIFFRPYHPRYVGGWHVMRGWRHEGRFGRR